MLWWIICCLFAFTKSDGACFSFSSFTSTFLMVKLQNWGPRRWFITPSCHWNSALFITQDIKHLGQKCVNWNTPMPSDFADVITTAQPVWSCFVWSCLLPQQQGQHGRWFALISLSPSGWTAKGKRGFVSHATSKHLPVCSHATV